MADLNLELDENEEKVGHLVPEKRGTNLYTVPFLVGCILKEEIGVWKVYCTLPTCPTCPTCPLICGRWKKTKESDQRVARDDLN